VKKLVHAIVELTTTTKYRQRLILLDLEKSQQLLLYILGKNMEQRKMTLITCLGKENGMETNMVV